MTHDRSAQVLADALHESRIGGAYDDSNCTGDLKYTFCEAGKHVEDAGVVLEVSPTLAAALAIGTAWLRVEAALPEGWEVRIHHRPSAPEYVHKTIAWVQDGITSYSPPHHVSGGPSPAEALSALADTLEGMPR